MLLHPGRGAEWEDVAQRSRRPLRSGLPPFARPSAMTGPHPERFARLTALAERLGIDPWPPPRRACTGAAAACSPMCSPRSAPGYGSTISGRAALANAEERLRSEAEMRRLFRVSRTPSTGPARWQAASTSRSTSCATNTPPRSLKARRLRRGLRAARPRGAALALSPQVRRSG